MTSSMRTTSSMQVANIPTESLSVIFNSKSEGHLLTVGLNPITPLQAAGILRDPPAPVPIPIGTTLRPTVPALPPLDPPAILLISKADLEDPHLF